MGTDESAIAAGVKSSLTLRTAIDRVRSAFGGSDDHSGTRRMAGTAFVIRVMSAAIAYVSQVLMARWMGGHDFGIYIYVWVWVLLLGHLCNAGLASAAQRFVPEFIERKDPDALRGYLMGARLTGVAIGTTVAALGLTVLWLFGDYVSHLTLIPLALACICLPLYVLTDIQDGIARSCNWTDLALGPPYLLRPILILATMAAGHVMGLPANAVVAMSCAVIATWATGLIQLFILHRRLARMVEPGPKRHTPSLWLKTSLPIFMVEGFYLLLTYTDVILLKQFRPPEEVAVYWAAVKTLALVAFVYFSVAAAAAHRFSEYHITGDRDKLSALLGESIRWTFFPSLAATILILIAGKPVLSLFGPNFVAGYPAMFIVSIGLLARAAVGPVEKLLSMSGHQGICAAIYGIAFLSSLVLCLVLIPRYGMMGAATATAVALVLESILLFQVTRYRLGLNVSIWNRPSPMPAE